MAFDGECAKEDFVSILENPFPVTLQPDLPDRTTDCCEDFLIHVLASAGDDDELKNDRKGFIWFFQPVIATVELTLQKKVGAAYVDQATLDDNTYGIFNALGFFTNSLGENAIHYELHWREVLIAFGLGTYRVEVVSTANLGLGLEGIFYSHEYCLMPYMPDRADGTVRIEHWMNGITGRTDDDRKYKDLGTLNFYDQIRLPGDLCGLPKTPYQVDHTEYNDGNRPFVEHTQEPEYTLNIKQVPAWVHEEFRINILMADEIAVTDYNAKNVLNLVQKFVQNAGSYDPDVKELQSKLAPVVIKLRQQYNNLRKLRF